MRLKASVGAVAGIAWLTSAAVIPIPRELDVDSETTCTSTTTEHPTVFVTVPASTQPIVPVVTLTVTPGASDPGSLGLPSSLVTPGLSQPATVPDAGSSTCTTTGVPSLGQGSPTAPVTVTVTQGPSVPKSTVTVPVLTVTLSGPSPASAVTTITIPDLPGQPGSGTTLTVPYGSGPLPSGNPGSGANPGSAGGVTITIPNVPGIPSTGSTITVPNGPGPSPALPGEFTYTIPDIPGVPGSGRTLTIPVGPGPSSDVTVIIPDQTPGPWLPVGTTLTIAVPPEAPTAGVPGSSGSVEEITVTIPEGPDHTATVVLTVTVPPGSGSPEAWSTIITAPVGGASTPVTVTLFPLEPSSPSPGTPTTSCTSSVSLGPNSMFTVTYTVPPEAGLPTGSVGTITVTPDSLSQGEGGQPATITVTAGDTPAVTPGVSGTPPGPFGISVSSVPNVVTYTVPPRGTTPGFTGVITITPGLPWSGAGTTGQAGTVTVAVPGESGSSSTPSGGLSGESTVTVTELPTPGGETPGSSPSGSPGVAVTYTVPGGSTYTVTLTPLATPSSVAPGGYGGAPGETPSIVPPEQSSPATFGGTLTVTDSTGLAPTATFAPVTATIYPSGVSGTGIVFTYTPSTSGFPETSAPEGSDILTVTVAQSSPAQSVPTASAPGYGSGEGGSLIGGSTVTVSPEGGSPVATVPFNGGPGGTLTVTVGPAPSLPGSAGGGEGNQPASIIAGSTVLTISPEGGSPFLTTVPLNGGPGGTLTVTAGPAPSLPAGSVPGYGGDGEGNQPASIIAGSTVLTISPDSGSPSVTTLPLNGGSDILTVTVSPTPLPGSGGGGEGNQPASIAGSTVLTISPDGGSPFLTTLPINGGSDVLTVTAGGSIPVQSSPTGSVPGYGGGADNQPGIVAGSTVLTITPASGPAFVTTLPLNGGSGATLTVVPGDSSPAQSLPTGSPDGYGGGAGSQPGIVAGSTVLTITPESGSPFLTTVPFNGGPAATITVAPGDSSPTQSLPTGSPDGYGGGAGSEPGIVAGSTVLTITPESGSPFVTTVPLNGPSSGAPGSLSGAVTITPGVAPTGTNGIVSPSVITIPLGSGSSIVVTIPATGGPTAPLAGQSGVLTVTEGLPSSAGVGSTNPNLVTITLPSGPPLVVTLPPSGLGSGGSVLTVTGPAATPAPGSPDLTVSEVTLSETIPIGPGQWSTVEFTTEVTLTGSQNAPSGAVLTVSLTPVVLTYTLPGAYGGDASVLTYTTEIPVAPSSSDAGLVTLTVPPSSPASATDAGQAPQVITIWPSATPGTLPTPQLITVWPSGLSNPSGPSTFDTSTTSCTTGLDGSFPEGATPSVITIWPSGVSSDPLGLSATDASSTSCTTSPDGSLPEGATPTVITIWPSGVSSDPLGLSATASSTSCTTGLDGSLPEGATPSVITLWPTQSTDTTCTTFMTSVVPSDPLGESTVCTDEPLATPVLTLPSSSPIPTAPAQSIPVESIPEQSIPLQSIPEEQTIPAQTIPPTETPAEPSEGIPPPQTAVDQNALGAYSFASSLAGYGNPAGGGGYGSPVIPTISPVSTSRPSPTPPTVCGAVGDRGEVTFDFEDLGSPSGSNYSLPSRPIPATYHRFAFSDGFQLAPSRSRYAPSSGTRLLQYNSSYVAQIGLGLLRATPCFSFDFLGIGLGCNSVADPCVFTISGLQFNGETDDVVATKTLEFSACTQNSSCTLSHQLLNSAAALPFRNLTSITIAVTVAGQPQGVWWTDDLQVAWTDNTCAAAACRSVVPNTTPVTRARGLLRWAARRWSSA